MMWMRHATRPRPSWLRVAITALGAAALLVGLLATHVVISGGHSGHAHSADSSASSTVPTADHTAHELHAMAALPAAMLGAAADPCDGTCPPAHTVIAMTCIIALLISVLVLVVAVIVRRWVRLSHGIRSLASRVAGLAFPDPPSLLVLSISRT
jgi:Family of unknown function (DUF6153)